MRKDLIIPIVVFVLIFLMPSKTSAQEGARIDLEKLKTVLQQERETIFIEALHLTVSQATVFHPIFVDFNKEKGILDEELIKLIMRYSNNYNLLDKDIMGSFIKKSKQYQTKEVAVRNKYYKRMSKEISTEIASQFYEVDDFLSTNLRLSVLMGLPFTSSIVQRIKN